MELHGALEHGVDQGGRRTRSGRAGWWGGRAGLAVGVGGRIAADQCGFVEALLRGGGDDQVGQRGAVVVGLVGFAIGGRVHVDDDVGREARAGRSEGDDSAGEMSGSEGVEQGLLGAAVEQHKDRGVGPGAGVQPGRHRESVIGSHGGETQVEHEGAGGGGRSGGEAGGELPHAQVIEVLAQGPDGGRRRRRGRRLGGGGGRGGGPEPGRREGEAERDEQDPTDRSEAAGAFGFHRRWSWRAPMSRRKYLLAHWRASQAA